MEVFTWLLRFVCLLKVLLVSSSKLPDEFLMDTTEYIEESTENPSDLGQYKEYINNLKCDKLDIKYYDADMIKVEEVESGTIYKVEPTTVDVEDRSVSEGEISQAKNKTSRWWSPALGLVANDARLINLRDNSNPEPAGKDSTSEEPQSHPTRQSDAKLKAPAQTDSSANSRISHPVGKPDTNKRIPAHPPPTHTSLNRRSHPVGGFDANKGVPAHPPATYSSFNRRSHPVEGTEQGTPTHPLPRIDSFFSSRIEEVQEMEQEEDESEYSDSSAEGTENRPEGGSSFTKDGPELHHDKGTTDKECSAPLSSGWLNYNWYQILLDNGGPPGGFLRGTLTGELERVNNACTRPFLLYSSLKHEGHVTYTYALPSVFRRERLAVRLAGTSKEFLDIEGHLLWTPPNATRSYHLRYRKDDSGLYAGLLLDRICKIETINSAFSYGTESEVRCRTYPFQVCECDDDGREICRPDGKFRPGSDPKSGPIPRGLQCSLVGGYGKC